MPQLIMRKAFGFGKQKKDGSCVDELLRRSLCPKTTLEGKGVYRSYAVVVLSLYYTAPLGWAMMGVAQGCTSACMMLPVRP